jgi:hypothetical protein
MNFDPTFTLGDLLGTTITLASYLTSGQLFQVNRRHRMQGGPPKIAWNTLHEEGGNISARLETGLNAHLMVLPYEILEDVTVVMNEDPLTVARANPHLIQAALDTAWRDQDRIRELVNIHSGERLLQLWLERGDFEGTGLSTLLESAR